MVGEKIDGEIQDLLKDIMRHILSHEHFHEITMECRGMAGGFEIVCHCEKSWVISSLTLSRSKMETSEINRYIRDLNTPQFFERLKQMKEDGAFVTEEKETLLEKTGSPTISSLEF